MVGGGCLCCSLVDWKEGQLVTFQLNPGLKIWIGYATNKKYRRKGTLKRASLYPETSITRYSKRNLIHARLSLSF